MIKIKKEKKSKAKLMEEEIRAIREDLISQNLTTDERKAMEQRLDEHQKLLDLITNGMTIKYE